MSSPASSTCARVRRPPCRKSIPAADEEDLDDTLDIDPGTDDSELDPERRSIGRRMRTDTSERGLERLICTALAGSSLRPASRSHGG